MDNLTESEVVFDESDLQLHSYGEELVEECQTASYSSFDYSKRSTFSVKPTYPPLLSRKEQNARRKRLCFEPADPLTKIVNAPYIAAAEKAQRASQRDEVVEENKGPVFNILRKPHLLMSDMSNILRDKKATMRILHETVGILREIVNATGVNLYVAHESYGIISLCKGEESAEDKPKVFKIELNKTIAASVAFTKKSVIVDDVAADERFSEVGCEVNDSIKSVLCVPIVTEDKCYAIIELYRDVTQASFTKSDLKISVVMAGWIGAAINQNHQRYLLQKEQDLSDQLLQYIKKFFGNAMSMEKFVSDIGMFAKETVQAERISFYTTKKDCSCIEAEVFEEGVDGGDGKLRKKNVKVHLLAGSIQGLVARTGDIINIDNAFEDPRYDSQADYRVGAYTTSLICMPIVGLSGILGLMQLANKKKSVCFTPKDENLLKTFSMYCALGVHYFKLNQPLSKLTVVNRSSKKLMARVIQPCSHNIKYYTSCPLIELPDNFDNFSWYITPDSLLCMPQYTMKMFVKIIGPKEIHSEALMKFILTVQKCYRDKPYHNYEHAFMVCHCMYNIILQNYDSFTLTERKALLIAAICHDIDHRGFTNNFLALTTHTFAQLYEDTESYMEHHHYHITVTLLEDANIFKSMTSLQFREMLIEIKALILVTDLAQHFKCRSKIVQLRQTATIEWWNPSHRRLIKDLMMSMADLSGQCKPFEYTVKIKDRLYREFYNEGDIEKSLGYVPFSMMDRDKQYLVPEDQVQFLTVVVIPCAELLMFLMPNTESLFKQALSTRELWGEIISLRGEKCWRQSQPLANTADLSSKK